MGSKVWVVAQQREGSLHRMSMETVAAGRSLADLTRGSVEVVLVGSGIDDLADDLAGRIGVDALHVLQDPELAAYTPEAWVAALAPVIREAAPDYVLFPHTYQSMDFFPRLAQRVGGILVTGAGAIGMEDGAIVWTRPILGGKLESKVRVKADRVGQPVLASVQSGAFSADDAPGGSTEKIVHSVDLSDLGPRREILSVEQAGEDEVDLSKAGVIVAAGRGVGGEDKMGVVEALAEALGAEIGASRPVIDNGWLPRDRQIGSSGQTVAPKLYVAVGISGAIQHLVGMKGSGTVVAINKDANAPIFSVSDYGIVGDLHEVLPALTEAIREAKG